MANTTNFGWETPDDTDLVKDGALAMRTLGNAIDTSLVDLKGGTTGQVLSKATNADMDFTWTNGGDITEVTAGTGLSGGGTSGAVTLTNTVATTFDAKGDLVVGTGADTFAKLVAGSNGDTLVADSSATTGLRWQGNFAAGKNKIINGDFNIWQRGTSVNLTNNTEAYQADRWICYSTFSAGTSVYSRQTFTPGTAPVAGYEGKFFARLAAGTTSTYGYFRHKIEDVQTFAGQTVTISIWAKASGTGTLAATIYQNFGSGGSASVLTSTSSQSLSSSWTRYTWTVAIPSISGKTVGTSSFLDLYFEWSGTLGSQTLDIWGAQIENGNTATAFQTATGTLAGELAACQRYYFRNNSGNTNYTWFAWGIGQGSSQALFAVPCPVTMRTTPTVVEFANLGLAQTGAITAITTLVHSNSSPSVAFLQSNGTNTADVFYRLIANNSSSAYVGIGAEL